ncbi:MAG: hypothetical protein IKU37_07735 [Candidatus Gastranaerophilales bacterium]|nr:hypothetical protein [Candidatus Gastranaerophilales bacterium]
MKKIFISLILIFLAHFFTIKPAYCEEDFFSTENFKKSKPKPPTQSVARAVENTKKKGLFSKFNRKTNNTENENQGYYGTLPDVEADFKYKKQTKPSSSQIDMKIPNEEIKEENLKKAPFDDSLFLDMVIKKEPDSQYVNDIQKIKFSLNNLKKCLENKDDIQKYNACVNGLELYVQNFKRKYENESESLKESYIEVINTNYYAKVLGNLKYDANYYSRYVPTQKGQYSEENISSKEEDLLNRINKTLFLLNNET